MENTVVISLRSKCDICYRTMKILDILGLNVNLFPLKTRFYCSGANMSKTQIYVFIISLFLVLPVYAAKKAGKVISVKGEVFMRIGLKKKAPVKVGDAVFEKAKITTSVDSEVVLDYGTSKITLGPKSYLKIPKATAGKDSTVKLNLPSGSIKFQVNKLSSKQSFTVKTPSAVAGVRGTDGEVTYSEGVTGCQSLPHQGGGKSVVYTAEPGDEAKMNNAIQQSRAAEETGKPQGQGSPQGVMVVNEGQASFTLPDGSAVLVDVPPGTSLSNMVKNVVSEIKKDASAKALKEKNAKDSDMSGLDEERLQNLIRILNVAKQAERARSELPGVPGLPD